MFKPTYGEAATLRVNAIGAAVTMLRRLAGAPLLKPVARVGATASREPGNCALRGQNSPPGARDAVVMTARRAYGFSDRPLATRLARHFGPRAGAELGIAAPDHHLGQHFCADFYQFQVRSLAAQQWAPTRPAILLHRAMSGLPAARRATIAN